MDYRVDAKFNFLFVVTTAGNPFLSKDRKERRFLFQQQQRQQTPPFLWSMPWHFKRRTYKIFKIQQQFTFIISVRLFFLIRSLSLIPLPAVLFVLNVDCRQLFNGAASLCYLSLRRRQQRPLLFGHVYGCFQPEKHTMPKGCGIKTISGPVSIWL